MGTPIPDPIIVPPVPAGNLCTNCWSVGKPFYDDDTPAEIVANFSGINRGSGWDASLPEPFNGEFVLVQDAFVNCLFVFDDGTNRVTILFTTTNTNIALTEAPLGDFFRSPSAGPCELLVENESTVRYIGGTCKITLPETQ